MLAHAAPHPRSGAIPGIINFNRLRSAGAGIIGKNERRPVQKGAAVKIRLTGLRAGTRPAGGELAVLQAASPTNNPLGLCLAGRPDFLLTVLRTPGNPKSEVRRPPRPARDIPICHLKVSGSVHRPRRGALYEPGTSYVRATYEPRTSHVRGSTRLNRNPIKPGATSYLARHWLLQGSADAAAGLPNVQERRRCQTSLSARTAVG